MSDTSGEEEEKKKMNSKARKRERTQRNTAKLNQKPRTNMAGSLYQRTARAKKSCDVLHLAPG